MSENFAQYVAFDLETTGLSSEKDQIIEVAGIKFTMEVVKSKSGKEKIVNKIISTFESFVRPTMHIPQEATNINHITDDMVKDAPDVVITTKKFMQFCGQSSILVAHNAPFDTRFLRVVIKNNELMIPQNPILDSLRISKYIMPESPNHKLVTLARRLRKEINLNLDTGNLHRALYDCEVLAEAFTAILRKRLTAKELNLSNCMKSFDKIHGAPLSFSTPNKFEK